jgi:threonine dehydrogenase-like Zn-dependent dehydrogenase
LRRIRAITVTPGLAGQVALTERDPPAQRDGELLLEVLALGVCGTDREIVSGEYGAAPEGSDQLVLGHESLARVREAPDGSDFVPGELVAGIVRRPDPVPCPCCARGEFDMCRNGGYREAGIKELDGYGAELVTLAPELAVKVDGSLGLLGVLTEPTSIVVKAWLQIDVARQLGCRPLDSVLVTGAGPIGLLAALLAKQRGLRVHVLDRATDGPKPRLVEALGGEYHSDSLHAACRAAEPDAVVECTGAAELVVDALRSMLPGSILCLLGVSPRGRTFDLDVGAINDELVLGNHVALGSVNANRAHFAGAAAALSSADRDWLGQLITRRVPLDRWSEALERRPDDIKAVIEFPAYQEGAA